jgi:ATP-dependent Clp protease adaptor protein ClpS
MSDSNAPSSPPAPAAPQTKTAVKEKPARQPPKPLPRWKVILHNDDVNDFGYVIGTILELTPLNEEDAILRTTEAHKNGIALLLVTHKERAELYHEQFTSKALVTTIEPDE